MSRPPRPLYTGVRTHIHPTAGFRLRIPSGWATLPVAEGHEGVVFGPSAASPETLLLAERIKLPFAVHEADAPQLRQGFAAGLQTLPELALEIQDESVSSTSLLFEARFTFLDNTLPQAAVWRKRWVRTLYAGSNQFLLIAQGSTPEEFDYWLPMFYNIMHTVELLPATWRPFSG